VDQLKCTTTERDNVRENKDVYSERNSILPHFNMLLHMFKHKVATEQLRNNI